MNEQGYKVEYEGQQYSSLKEFADAFHLNYSKVTAHYRKGEPLEDIVQNCQFSVASKAKRTPPETRKRKYVEFNGVKYTSIYAAADALGISPGRVYSVRERLKCSPEKAIEYVYQNAAPAGAGNSPNASPCVIEGIQYPSREAALAAYRMKRITVYSRMKREGISFEEAIVRGKNKAVYRKPVSSLFPRLHLIQIDQEINLPEILADLSRSLAYYHSKVEVLADILSGVPALFVDGQTFLCYNSEARGIEMVTELPFSMDTETVNMFNESYVAVKLFMSKAMGSLVLTTFQSAKESGQRIDPLLNAWFSYTSIRDNLLRRFDSKHALAVPAKKIIEKAPAEV